MSVREDFLLHMGSHPYFVAMKKELEDGLPPVPTYNHVSDNTEEWKYRSAQREGYLLCLAKFGITVK